MTRFADLGLADPLLQALSEEGYETPTPIQGSVIPDMLAGRDILGIAQTGTGKTAAFVLPVLQAFAEELASGTVRRPAPKTAKTLILVPTRELAYQVAESIRTYGRHLAYQMAVVVGGVRPQGQIRAMKPGVDILVATPGRLEDHMSTGVVSLEATRTLILDEADQMLDMGFIPSIRRIVAKVPNPRRTVMLTATMAPPIRALAGDFLKDPSELSVAPVSKPIERIAQSVLPIRQPEKRNALVHYLRDQDVERAIVFTRTKRGADRVSRHLEECGFASAAIHGNRSQSQRDRALNAFKAGEVQVLVATDIAARGIDIDDVSHVVNFELPTVPEAYVHRIGRTARAGKSGVALSLCDPAERNLLRDIERLTKLPIAEAKLSFDPSEELRVAPVRPFAPKPRQEHREEAAAAPPRR
ncbi:MAG: DEAD/DEAH box helicase, partial [Rhodospirillaceae bacterium]